MKTFGYKSSKTGFNIGTRFEYLEDFTLGLSTSSFYEDIVTNSDASTLQKNKQETIGFFFKDLTMIKEIKNLEQLKDLEVFII